MKSWETADYAEWNVWLVDHALRGPYSLREISNIPASPEELRAAVGETAANSEDVEAAFVAAVQAQLPPGRSFCGFCGNVGTWTPQSSGYPHFFGMLWFTCLVAAGHGDDHGSFTERFVALIGKSDNLRDGQGECLNRLWEDIAAWTEAQPSLGTLVLPPEDGWRSVIGRSYYLAMPNRRDRHVLRGILSEKDLVGLDPPLLPVIAALELAGGFSRDFQAAFEHFRQNYVSGSRAPWDSPFWRAIRHEAREGLLTEREQAIESTGLTLLASWDPEEALQLCLACTGDPELTGTQLRESNLHFEDLPIFLSDEDGSTDVPVARLLARSLTTRPGLDSMVGRGVLIFQEALTNEYRLAAGEDIEGADLALVRQDRATDFVGAFGGEPADSSFPGWVEVVECSVRQLSELPDGLAGVQHLFHTSSAPRPRLFGGVKSGSEYLPILLPQIKAPGALRVECRRGDSWQPCVQAKDEGVWRLPSNVDARAGIEIVIRATYEVQVGDRAVQRFSERSFRTSSGSTGFEYKTLGAGTYWRECANREQEEIAGGNQVPLEITTEKRSDSADLLKIDPEVYFLGPCRGSVALERDAHSTWKAVGHLGKPHLLLFLGNLDDPVLPEARESPNKGDRRTWRKTFASSSTLVVASVDGQFLAEDADSRLASVHSAYARGARDSSSMVRSGDRVLEKVKLGEGPAEGVIQPTAAANALREAIAAMGVRRSRLPLKEVQNLVLEVLGAHVRSEAGILHLCSQVIRAWAESGSFDLLRSVDRSQTLVVPRRPRLVMVNRGPHVDATLIGLAPGLVHESVANELGGRPVSVNPTTEFQPPVLRIRGTTSDVVRRASRTLGLPSPEWLDWPDPDHVPDRLQVKSTFDGMRHGAPPDAYEFHALWDWELGRFARRPERRRHHLVEVERRRHPSHCAIFVVLLDGESMCWGHMRSWALLRAFELREKPPFRIAESGVIEANGANPVHLPIPFGRLCAVTGVGLSGPIVSQDGEVTAYRYSFGRHSLPLAMAAIPGPWLSSEE